MSGKIIYLPDQAGLNFVTEARPARPALKGNHQTLTPSLLV